MTVGPLAVSKDAEITTQTGARWQTIATLPEERFEAHIAETKDAAEELMTAGMPPRPQRGSLRAGRYVAAPPGYLPEQTRAPATAQAFSRACASRRESPRKGGFKQEHKAQAKAGAKAPLSVFGFT